MNKKLRILILEDAPTDAELILRELKKGGIVFSYKRVMTKEDFQRELKELKPDLILSDHVLPQFNGLTALSIVRAQFPDMPFIFVTGAMGEEWAIETLKKGATDYVLKQGLPRLVPVIMRALREAEVRAEQRHAEEALRESESRYRAVFENTGTAMIIFDEDMTISLTNRECEKISGYSKQEVEGKKKWTDFVHKDDLKKMMEYHQKRGTEFGDAPKQYEFRLVDREGRVKNVFLTVDLIPGTPKRVASLLDITESKKAEEEIRKRIHELEDFYQMAVGRELRMIELKEQLEEMKEQIEKLKEELAKYKPAS